MEDNNNMKKAILLLLIPVFFIITSCTSVQKEIGNKNDAANRKFLEVDREADEVFRVFLTSDDYIVSQMKYTSSINRVKDRGGDRYICDEVKKLDKIDEMREGLVSLWLYPDSGRIMKIRTQKSTYILEIDKLISEDIQRWNFSFPKKYTTLTRFDVKYRVVLRKTLSDAEIIKEVQEKMRDQQ